jgi:hypothetical protein
MVVFAFDIIQFRPSLHFPELWIHVLWYISVTDISRGQYLDNAHAGTIASTRRTISPRPSLACSRSAAVSRGPSGNSSAVRIASASSTAVMLDAQRLAMDCRAHAFAG